MKFFTLITGPLEVNTYILSNKAGECVVIDPADAKRTRELLREQGLTCTHVLLTHCHFDHITGDGRDAAARSQGVHLRH